MSTFPPDWVADVGAVSVIFLLISSSVKYGREWLVRTRKARAEKQVEQLRLTLVSEGPSDQEFFQQILSTSTAQAPSGTAEGPPSIVHSRHKISATEQKIANPWNEIVEARKMDAVFQSRSSAS